MVKWEHIFDVLYCIFVVCWYAVCCMCCMCCILYLCVCCILYLYVLVGVYNTVVYRNGRILNSYFWYYYYYYYYYYCYYYSRIHVIIEYKYI